MAYQHIELERANRIATIWLNRPRYRNAQSRLLLDEMTDAFRELDYDNEVKVIILAGRGEHFSAGHDLGTPEELEDAATKPFGDGTMGRLNRSWHLYIENSLRWRDVKKPTIAAVQGYCIFGGFMIASCMDLIIASKDAKFLPSHLQMFTAPWDLGIRKSKQILFENRFIPAGEALELGLVTEVVENGNQYEAAVAQAEKFAENSLMTLRMLKHSINSAQDAMGYRQAVEATHSNYMMLEMSASIKREGDKGEELRLGGVKDALAKEDKTDKS
jgi:enoyl-CoA hydratase